MDYASTCKNDLLSLKLSHPAVPIVGVDKAAGEANNKKRPMNI